MEKRRSFRWFAAALCMLLMLAAVPSALADVCNADGITYPSHAWGSWDTTKEPTCTENGTRVRYCTRCKAKDTDTITCDLGTTGIWIDAREALLQLFYPGQEAAVTGIVNDTVRQRVTSLCGEAGK